MYDLTRSDGDRVVSVRARCKKCRIPHYDVLRDEDILDVITNSFLLDGGDGHEHLTKYTYRDNGEILALDVVREYLKVFNPVLPQLEDRIRFVSRLPAGCLQSFAVRSSVYANLIFGLLLFTVSLSFFAS